MAPYISKMKKEYWGLYSGDNNLIYMNKDKDKVINQAKKLGFKDVEL